MAATLSRGKWVNAGSKVHIGFHSCFGRKNAGFTVRTRRHDIETLSALLALCEWNPSVRDLGRTKWPTFCGLKLWNAQYRNRRLCLGWKSIFIGSLEFNRYVITNSGNDLWPDRRQTITWTNDDAVDEDYMFISSGMYWYTSLISW